MEKKIVKIFDTAFAHVPYCTLNNESKNIVWDRSGIINDNDLVFFTDASLNRVHSVTGNCKKFAWLIEPPAIQDNYSFIKDNWQHFDMIFTHQSKLLELSDRFKWTPMWCTWIKPENQKITPKSKGVSIIASPKKDAPGHRLRHEIINSLQSVIELDKFGRDFKFIDEKSEGLLDYRFSFIIENDKDPIYFTEKLIDCLVCGTIPIYWGAERVGEHFDTRGFFIVNSLDDILSIVDKLNEETYQQMLPYVISNYETAKKYCSVEDFIYENYLTPFV